MSSNRISDLGKATPQKIYNEDNGIEQSEDASSLNCTSGCSVAASWFSLENLNSRLSASVASTLSLRVAILPLT
jgi:hypothetical protein